MEQRLREADRRAIATALPAESVLVEFVRFNVFDFRAVPARDEPSWRPARYLAFILPARRPDDVRMVDLGEAEPIDQLLTGFLAVITNEQHTPQPSRSFRPKAAQPEETVNEGTDLRRALFDPLARFVDGCTRLFLAPDGDLARLPFEVLPNADGGHLIDDYLISYLGVGRDVPRFMSEVTDQPGDPVVAADPDFDLTSSGIASPAETNALRERRQSRDLDRGSLRFDRLQGTRVEGERIAASLGVPPLLQHEVLEARLKAQRSPRILHLATHGFFLPDQPRESDNGVVADQRARRDGRHWA